MTEIDKLEVKLVADTKNLIDGLSKTEKAVDKLEKEMIKADNSTKQLSAGFHEYSSATKSAEAEARLFSSNLETLSSDTEKAFSGISQMNKSVSAAEIQFSSLNDSLPEVSENLSDISSETEKAVAQVSNLDNTLSKIGKFMSITAVMSALNSLREEAKRTAKEYENMSYSIALATGTLSQDYVSAAESLVGLVPGTKAELGEGLGILATRQPNLKTDELRKLLSEYAISSELFGEGLTTIIRQSDEAFKKWGVSSVEEQIKALSELRVVCEESDIAYSQLINTLSSGDAEFQMMGHTFTEAASMIGSANLEGNLGDLQSYLSSMQKISTSKAGLFSSDTELKEYMLGVGNAVKKAEDLSQATNILTTEFEIQGMAAQNVAKYLMGFNNAISAEDVALKAATTSNREWYQSIETSTTLQERANEVEWESVKALGDVSIAFENLGNKAEIAAKSLYDFYGIPSLPLKDIPVLGDFLSSVGITKTPEIGITIPKANYLDNYPSVVESLGATLTDTSFDWKYYQNLRKQADTLGIDYSDLRLQPGAGTLMESDVKAGKYDELLSRIDELLATLEKKQSGNVTVTQYISAPVADSYTIKNAAQKGVEASQASGMRLM